MSKNQSNDNGVGNDEWETPDSLFNQLTEEFHFNWDLACTSENIKTISGSMADRGLNGLKFSPDDRREYSIWCNPPYKAKPKEAFAKKCYELSLLPNVKSVVLLIPSATETNMFHDLLAPNCEIRLLRKRVKFMGVNTKGVYVTDKSGQSGSMVCIFGKNPIIIPYDSHNLKTTEDKDGM